MAHFSSLDQVQSILVMRLSAIGDCVLTVPMVQTIRKHYPHITIDWMVDPIAYSLLNGLEGVNFIVVKKPRKFAEYRQFYKDYKGKSWDLLIAAQYSLRANLLYPAINAKMKLGFGGWRARDGHKWFVDATVKDKPSHLLDGTFEFLEYFGETRRELAWPFALPELADFEQGQPLVAEDYIVINPAASSPKRSWLAERYAAVADYAIQHYGVKVVLSGGPAAVEKELAAAVEKHSKHSLINLVGKTSLKELAAVLKGAKAVISPDTGPAHIAAAVGTPTIGLYTSVPAKATGPYTSLEHTVDKYLEAAEKYLGKQEHQLKWHERVNHDDAMALIEVNDVVEKLEKILG